MLTVLKRLLIQFIDSLLPKRSDFEIVQKLDEEAVNSLPKSSGVKDAEWIHPLFDYKNNKVRALVWELKYKNDTKPLEYVGKILFDEIMAKISDISTFDSDASFLLIPIPITERKRSLRGYNQSEYIAKAVHENDLGHSLLYAPQWFSKIKETPEQNKSHSKEERAENLSGCFEARSEVEGKYIILIDDVVTTGSTLKEARKTLLETGAKSVYAFTIAH